MTQQQVELSQQQDAMAEQIQMLNATIQEVQEANTRAQANAQSSVVTLQEIVTITNTNLQETTYCHRTGQLHGRTDQMDPNTNTTHGPEQREKLFQITTGVCEPQTNNRTRK